MKGSEKQNSMSSCMSEMFGNMKNFSHTFFSLSALLFFLLSYFLFSHLLFDVCDYVLTLSILICASYKKALCSGTSFSFLNSASPYVISSCLTLFSLKSCKFDEFSYSTCSRFNIVLRKFMPIQNFRIQP